MKHTVVGADVAKRVSQVHWVERETGEIVSQQIKRDRCLEHFANRTACLVGMEACEGSQHWARELCKLGHDVKLVSARMVKAFVGVTRMMWQTLERSGLRYSNQDSRR